MKEIVLNIGHKDLPKLIGTNRSALALRIRQLIITAGEDMQ